MEGDQPSADTIDESFIPCVRRDVDRVEIEGELLLFDESHGAWHLLNPAATMVWAVADAQGSVKDLARDIAEFTKSDPEAVVKDVLTVVRDFARRGLLEGIPRIDPHTHDHGHANDDTHTHHTEPGQTSNTTAERESSEGPQPRFLAVPPSS